MTTSAFFKILDTVDSTNNYAMAQLHAGLASHGMAWFALDQTAGKGQRGKSWKTEPGQNIAMSLLVQPLQLKSRQQFNLSMQAALTVFEFFSAYAGTETSIKWPNDLYWRDRKAGGILIENVFHGREWKWAVIGIGININQVQFDPALPNPVSLRQISGKEYDISQMGEELYKRLIKKMESIEGADDILKDYNKNLYRLNKPVKLKKGKTSFDTVVKGVSANGRLITVDATEHQFDFGEVEWEL